MPSFLCVLEKAGAGGRSALAQRAKAESWAQWSLTDGMQNLPDALQEALSSRERVELHHSAPVRTLSYTTAGWEVGQHVTCTTEKLKKKTIKETLATRTDINHHFSDVQMK